MVTKKHIADRAAFLRCLNGDYLEETIAKKITHNPRFERGWPFANNLKLFETDDEHLPSPIKFGENYGSIKKGTCFWRVKLRSYVEMDSAKDEVDVWCEQRSMRPKYGEKRVKKGRQTSKPREFFK